MNMLRNIYNDKKILITGHTGFKGSWLACWLLKLGADVYGISKSIPTSPSHFEAALLGKRICHMELDVQDAEVVKKKIREIKPDFVFHLAAQALVRPSYESPLDTLTTNAIGTANILEALRFLDKRVIAIMITSDKVYDNVEWVWGYRESDRLGGKDPYSASKGMAELAIRTYVESFFKGADPNVRIGITRAGNVIGGGDWAKDRIVPDCIRAWSCGEIVDIRSPNATRPWQHVLEPLSGYLVLGAELAKRPSLHGEAYNFGPPAHQNNSVRELIDEMAKHWNNVRWNDISQSQGHVHEAGLLKLNCDKALFDLGWRAALNFEDTVRMTVEWYKNYYKLNGDSMQDFTMGQIKEYTDLAEERGLKRVDYA